MRFRIRSSARDESADARRLSLIERSVLNAIADAEAERKGLTRRSDDAKVRASMLIGTEPSEYLDRDQKTEQLLLGSENELLAAEKRIKQLTAHLEHLRHVLELLKQK